MKRNPFLVIVECARLPVRRSVQYKLGKRDTQTKEAVLQVCDLLDEPPRWNQYFHRAAASMALSAVYGYPTLTSEQDNVVAVVNEFAERIFKALYIGAHLVEFFPWLRHLPNR
jgi:hypothetical protein